MSGLEDVSNAVTTAMATFTGAGVAVTPVRRGWRWVAELPGGMIAYVAEDDDGWARLRREELLLKSIAPRMTVAVPEVCFSMEPGRVQLRRMTAGRCGFWIEELVCGLPGHVPYAQRLRLDFPLTVQGEQLAFELGRALAQLQRALSEDEASELALSPVTYLDDLDQIEGALLADGSLGDLMPVVPGLRSWVRALPLESVLIHGDLYAPNLALDDSGHLSGIFDFESAALGQRLDDFKYLPGFGLPFMERLLESYEQHGAATVAKDDVWKIHALSALEHLTRVSPGTLRRSRVVEWSRAVVRLLG